MLEDKTLKINPLEDKSDDQIPTPLGMRCRPFLRMPESRPHGTHHWETERRHPSFSPSVRECIERAAVAASDDFMPHQGWVLIALQNAFYQLLHADNFVSGLSDTVMRGGDTDTNAAIAGALLGAVHGRDAVPQSWRCALLSCRPLPDTPTAHPRPMDFWPVDALELTERLVVSGTDSAVDRA